MADRDRRITGREGRGPDRPSQAEGEEGVAEAAERDPADTAYDPLNRPSQAEGDREAAVAAPREGQRGG